MPAWTEQPIHLIDFEGSRRSGILEYGVATVHRGLVTQLRTRLCAPSGRILGEETQVHGLDETALAGAAPFAQEWTLFCALRKEGPLGAHYAGVENSLLKAVWPYPPASPDFTRPGETLVDWGPWVDTGALFAQWYPQFPSTGLESLVASTGLQEALEALAGTLCPEGRRRYHAAPYDALASALLLCALARGSTGELSLLQLLVHSTRSPDRRAQLNQDLLPF